MFGVCWVSLDGFVSYLTACFEIRPVQKEAKQKSQLEKTTRREEKVRKKELAGTNACVGLCGFCVRVPQATCGFFTRSKIAGLRASPPAPA
jgi:hypothetical protein